VIDRKVTFNTKNHEKIFETIFIYVMMTFCSVDFLLLDTFSNLQYMIDYRDISVATFHEILQNFSRIVTYKMCNLSENFP